MLTKQSKSLYRTLLPGLLLLLTSCSGRDAFILTGAVPLPQESDKSSIFSGQDSTLELSEDTDPQPEGRQQKPLTSDSATVPLERSSVQSPPTSLSPATGSARESVSTHPSGLSVQTGHMWGWVLGTVILLVGLITAALAGLLAYLSPSSNTMNAILAPFIASLHNKLNGSTEPPVTDKRNQLTDSSIFTSKRFLVLAGSLVGLYYLGALLAPNVLQYGTYLVITYIVCDTVKGSVLAISNAIIHSEEVRQDVEYERLAQSKMVTYGKANP